MRIKRVESRHFAPVKRPRWIGCAAGSDGFEQAEQSRERRSVDMWEYAVVVETRLR